MGVGHFARECPEGDGGRDVGRGGYGGDSGGFGGGSHREGLSQCGDEDLLQVRRYWSHLEGVPQRQPGLVEPRRYKTSHLQSCKKPLLKGPSKQPTTSSRTKWSSSQ